MVFLNLNEKMNVFVHDEVADNDMEEVVVENIVNHVVVEIEKRESKVKVNVVDENIVDVVVN